MSKDNPKVGSVWEIDAAGADFSDLEHPPLARFTRPDGSAFQVPITKTADGAVAVIVADRAGAWSADVVGKQHAMTAEPRPEDADLDEPSEEVPARPHVDVVLDEVGDDVEKAKAALADENASDNPRPDLVAQLELISAG